jgi:membrane associated rhomboid family serine protease
MAKNQQFDDHLWNAIPPAFMITALMWLIYLLDKMTKVHFYVFGILPGEWKGVKGIIFSPWIHDNRDINHILSNSIPIFLLSGLLFYSYKQISFRVFGILWFFSGMFVWLLAEKNGAYHIGMSGIIYGLAGFLFTSGVLRKYLPLQALSLIVVFLYGSMIWGVFPTAQPISWEGHLSGMLAGVFLAFFFRKQGPQRPKFQYEIEKELGIEPPDLEGQYWEKVREEEARLKALEEEKPTDVRVNYEYVTRNEKKENN